MPVIKHHGAVDGVTGSCHELVIDEQQSLLIDCGLFQGAEYSEGGAKVDRLQIEFPVDHIAALFVTHAHIDHVGRIPYLFATGFDGPIFCSKPTAILLPAVLEDAIKVGFTRNVSLVQRVVAKICRNIIGVDYKRWVDLNQHLESESNVRARFSPAGHILGSAYIEFDVKEKSSDKRVKRVFDLMIQNGTSQSPFCNRSSTTYYAPDVLVTSSTLQHRKLVAAPR